MAVATASAVVASFHSSVTTTTSLWCRRHHHRSSFPSSDSSSFCGWRTNRFILTSESSTGTNTMTTTVSLSESTSSFAALSASKDNDNNRTRTSDTDYVTTATATSRRALQEETRKRGQKPQLSARNNIKENSYHTVNGIECVAISIPLALPAESGMTAVTILEATASAQDELVNFALLTEEELQQQQLEKLDSPSSSSATSKGLLLSSGDPYGTVLWPAATVVAKTLLQFLSHNTKNLTHNNNNDNYGGSSSTTEKATSTITDIDSTTTSNTIVLELGAGTGLVSLAALLAGANHVIATDFEPLPLALLRYAAEHLNHRPNASPPDNDALRPSLLDRLDCQLLDLCNSNQSLPLPLMNNQNRYKSTTINANNNSSSNAHYFVVAADVMYEPRTGRALAKRIVQALQWAHSGAVPPPPSSSSASPRSTSTVTVIVGDSPGRPGRPAFLQELRMRFNDPTIDFVNVTGWTVQGHRHELICGPNSTSTTPQQQELTVALLILSSNDYGQNVK